jgi:hypothetical protein
MKPQNTAVYVAKQHRTDVFVKNHISGDFSHRTEGSRQPGLVNGSREALIYSIENKSALL